MRPIAQHYNSVESQARFRTIPVNEFIDGVTITPLGVQAGEAIQDCGFGCSSLADRYFSSQPRISRAIYLAHSASAQRRDDFVRS